MITNITQLNSQFDNFECIDLKKSPKQNIIILKSTQDHCYNIQIILILKLKFKYTGIQVHTDDANEIGIFC